ncbi:MAG: glycosyltransferase family 4 protein [Clostridiales Family XIII bacterium]|jgi:glycosyltransferase involved in cell wall biosynthesis|nr:glycosyltransferase family 4 protein [Clostridiales Family XIII bacterium]
MSLVNFLYRHKGILTKFIPFGFARNLNRKYFAKKINLEPYKNKLGFQKKERGEGVNIIASLIGVLSLKNSVNMIHNEIKLAGISTNYYDYVENIIEGETMAPYNINLVHAGPVGFFADLPTLPRELWQGKYNMYYFIWELEKAPITALPIVNFFDEIWTPSKYAAKPLLSFTNKPITVVPYAISVCPDKTLTRKDFGLPENKFLILTMYDGRSDTERKNPDAVIKAYKKAFLKENDDVFLVLKISKPDEEVIKKLKKDLRDYKNIIFMTDTISLEKVHALISLCDLFISLPRAEGFGLIFAEAMFLETAIIATNYSAHTEFIPEDCGCLVKYKMIPVTKKSALYQKGAMWADADIDDAAKYILKLFNDNDYRYQIVKNAKDHITKFLSKERISDIIRNRISDILFKKQTKYPE